MCHAKVIFFHNQHWITVGHLQAARVAATLTHSSANASILGLPYRVKLQKMTADYRVHGIRSRQISMACGLLLALALAACGDSPPGTRAGSADAAATARPASLIEVTMPPATQIVDATGGKWTLVDGIALLNGERAGGNANTVAVSYARKTIYSKNHDGLWFVWTGAEWAGSKEPEQAAAEQKAADDIKAAAEQQKAAAAAAAASLAASGLPAIPVTTQRIKDAEGKTWTLENGVALLNGQPAGGNANTVAVVYANKVIYSENAAGLWFEWQGGAWVGSKNPVEAISEQQAEAQRKAADEQAATAVAAANAKLAASGLPAIPANAKALKDASGHNWTLVDGVALLDGAPAGGNANTIAVVYADKAIHTLNRAGMWFTWDGDGWIAAGEPHPAGKAPAKAPH